MTNGSANWLGTTNQSGMYLLNVDYVPTSFSLTVEASKLYYENDTEIFPIYIDPPAVDYFEPVTEYSSAFSLLVMMLIIGANVGLGAKMVHRRKKIENS